ncbi:centrosomal protein 15 [Latimeria chalumnae]|uniref:Centrosomal protein 15 n=1 Tax=Latimeria chalumnae TaxID=7897 RepID=H3AZZ4_LATCH|nr:PREDICTED: uncharacterized protein C3orf14 homolog [Latimeria chalumnae]XP_006001182.1 PREDICTED: uncharacterized protein C3orf14 homolog [Latimeria chalumnae]XP_006001183.1 PREDICTED: uncharacterized protein C3orf14 homolog [Latimeria chalumnae]XP_006001184.1 PREDICTED: uncharacterized protein C3orf14 homolog [Latimeria chalumnae]XP_006001185.1 PREDICTED: uncharacterized protein C3orf14 homolog [Latimeria chalumnae]XP_014347008.1 PREDICTED: uncharacterized protein C3orf14 homolog [Latimeri|eukprot:XP_006001181.1 PREDICTED: uncharacterized protein C3orf14 homolog [Latimeria chalumnae]
MASYLAQEVELSRRHEEILAQRVALLQQVESQLEDQKNGKKLKAEESEAAHKRNVVLLHDLEKAEETLSVQARMLPHPDTVKLETRYWASVEEKLPKWEQFLLGKALSLDNVGKSRKQKQSPNPKKTSQEKQKTRASDLPPSGFISKS